MINKAVETAVKEHIEAEYEKISTKLIEQFKAEMYEQKTQIVGKILSHVQRDFATRWDTLILELKNLDFTRI